MSHLNTTYPMSLDRGTVNGAAIPSGWMAQHELATELAAADPALDLATWRTILSALSSNMPVVMTRLDPALTSIRGRRVDATLTVMLEYVTVHGSTGRIRTRAWGGFSSEWFTDQIVSVTTPDVTYSDEAPGDPEEPFDVDGPRASVV